MDKVSFLTIHGKEKILRNYFSTPLSMPLVHTNNFNTDNLGTFTREVDREQSQFDTAKTKAILSMELTNCNYGLGSEGAFYNNPFPWHSEIIVFSNYQCNTIISGHYQGPAFQYSISTFCYQELINFALANTFPYQHIVLRNGRSGKAIFKGINTVKQLRKIFLKLKHAFNTPIFAELDLRAHCSPRRRIAIIKATKNLVDNYRKKCKLCFSPGFTPKKSIQGLPCEICLYPTLQLKAHQWQCSSMDCQYQEIIPLKKTTADPLYCPICNP